MKIRVTFLPVLPLLLCGLCGCRSFNPHTPPGFVELKNSPSYDYRSVSAEGVVLAVRAIDHDPKGDLDFWTRSVEKEVRLLGGYALLETRAVTAEHSSGAGKEQGGKALQGKQLRFGHDEGRTPHLYYVTLFVTDSKIFLLEAGGPKVEMEKVTDKLDEAVRNFEPR